MNSEQLYQELCRISKCLLTIDLTNEEGLKGLDSLQGRQQQIRDALDRYNEENGFEPTSAIQEYVQEAIEAEQQFIAKLSRVKEEASRQLTGIQSTRQIRNSYGQQYTQSDGYFIDYHK